MLAPALVAVALSAAPLDEQIHQKRLEQLAIGAQVERAEPELLFRLADLWWEEARYWLLEQNEAQSRVASTNAVALAKVLLERFPTWPRNDEALSALGNGLLDLGDDARAQAAFKRLVQRYPESPLVFAAHFKLGEYLAGHANGRRDWVQRARAAYVKAAGTPAASLRAEALFKEGWCAMNLADFDAALDRFAAVAKLDVARAKEAQRAWVLTWVRSGGRPGAARAGMEALTKTSDERRALEQQLAERYHADGFDREAAVTWQGLIVERPDAPEAFGFQVAIVDALSRVGNRELTVEQVRRLVELSSALPATVDRRAAEPLLAKLATTWHTECRKTREDGCLRFPSAVYEAVLALFPAGERSYELHFFFAELLFDSSEFARAAEQYRAVVERDAACMRGGACRPGKFLEAAALGEIHAREALALRDQSQHGGRSAGAPRLAQR